MAAYTRLTPGPLLDGSRDLVDLFRANVASGTYRFTSQLPPRL
jgi:hypothetical protein